MTLSLEIKKLKRAGYFPAFLGGALLAAAFPLLNMLIRAETFTGLPGNPLRILTDANWQMMSMLNMLTLICGTCMMYHIEYADNGIQKMEVLPVHSHRIFFEKWVITVLCLIGMLFLETTVLAGCAFYWFPNSDPALTDLIKHAGFASIMILPTALLMLWISSVCRNIWISLGTGVILVFNLSILPADNLFFVLCPFNSPYQTLLSAAENDRERILLPACIIETLLLGGAKLLFTRLRRYFA